ncbi:hypothetical protein NN561_002863 [Cricetulus griseus]
MTHSFKEPRITDTTILLCSLSLSKVTPTDLQTQELSLVQRSKHRVREDLLVPGREIEKVDGISLLQEQLREIKSNSPGDPEKLHLKKVTDWAVDVRVQQRQK